MSAARARSQALAAVDAWFAAKGWSPFPFQRRCWKAYLDGCDGLLHAATGAGQTLAVGLGPFLEALAEPTTGAATRILWVTPLRALADATPSSLRQS